MLKMLEIPAGIFIICFIWLKKKKNLKKFKIIIALSAQHPMLMTPYRLKQQDSTYILSFLY